MGVSAGLYMCDIVKKKFTFAISSRDEFLFFKGKTVFNARNNAHGPAHHLMAV